jgi:SAM-dependent methyltransferase
VSTTWSRHKGDPDANRTRAVPDAADDAARLDDMMFENGSTMRARPWCDPVASQLAAHAVTHLEQLRELGRPAKVVDYGAGTGLASKYLWQALADLAGGRRAPSDRVELLVADLPGPWFRASDRLRDIWGDVPSRSLQDAAGRIRRLDEVVEPGTADVVLANAVLHLVPPRALERAIQGIAATLRPGGVFVWTSPDSAPALPGGVLFHDPNRLIRELFVTQKMHRAVLQGLAPGEREEAAALVAAASEPTAVSHLQARRQIPTPATKLIEIIGCLERHFAGNVVQIGLPFTAEDMLRCATVPSNLKNLNEIATLEDRTRLCELLFHEVIPLLRLNEPGRRSIALTWAIGAFRRKDSTPCPESADRP